MQVLRVLRVGWWIAVVALAIYVGVMAVAAYFKAVEAVESTVNSVTHRDMTQRSMTGAATDNYSAVVREEIIVNVRKNGVPVEPGKVRVSQSGGTLSVELSWAQPMVSVSGETVLAAPLWVSRKFEVK